MIRFNYFIAALIVCSGIGTNELSAAGEKDQNGSATVEMSNFLEERDSLLKKDSLQRKRDLTLLSEVSVIGNKKRDKGSVMRLPAPLEQLPISLSTVSSEEWELREVSSIYDALEYTVGLKPVETYGGFQTFTLRGFGSPVVMIDGVRDERFSITSSPLTSMAAVSSVEFLKGAASVISGHSAVGGVLNIIRNRPTVEQSANFKASYGSWNRQKLSLGAGGSITDDMQYRFDFAMEDEDGWRDRGDQVANGYAALDFNLGERANIELRGGANRDLYGTETGLPSVTSTIYSNDGTELYSVGELPTNFDREQRYNDPRDYLLHKDFNGLLIYNQELSNSSSLRFSASYSDDLIDYFSTEELSYITSSNPISDTYYLKDEAKVYISLDTLQRTFPLRFSHETDSYQNAIEFQKRVKGSTIDHALLVGYSFLFMDRVSFKGYNLGSDVYGDGLYGKISVVNPILDQGELHTKFSAASLYKESVHGLYGQDLITLTDMWSLFVGLRYDNYRLKNSSASVESERNLSEIQDWQTIINNAFTYRGGAVFKPNNLWQIYASSANYFRPNRSFFNENYIYLDRDGEEFFPVDGEELYKPESGYQLEGGFRYAESEKLSISGSIYYILKENIVENLGNNSDGDRVYGQVGAIDSKGGELEISASPLSGLDISLNYGYNKTLYRDFTTNSVVENAEQGNRVAQTPENKVALWAHYSPTLASISRLSLGVGLNYTDKVYTNSSNSSYLSGYWKGDLQLGYRGDNIEVNLALKNITDTNFYSGTVYSTQYIPGEGRNVTLSVAYSL